MRLAKLILCDTRPAADSPEGAQGRLATAEKVLHEGARFVANSMPAKLFAPQAIDEQPKVVAATRQVMLNTKPQAIAAAPAWHGRRVDFRDRLTSIDVPTLVLGGTFDGIVPLAEMRDMAAQIPGLNLPKSPPLATWPRSNNQRLRME